MSPKKRKSGSISLCGQWDKSSGEEATKKTTLGALTAKTQMGRAAVWSQPVPGGVAGVAGEDGTSDDGRHFLNKRVGHVLPEKGKT